MACCGLLWPVMACYAVKKFSHVFTLSLLSSSQDSPGYRDPTLNLFLNLTSELPDKTNASCHPSQLGAELLLEFWWNFGALYTVFTRYTLHTLHHLVSVVSP